MNKNLTLNKQRKKQNQRHPHLDGNTQTERETQSIFLLHKICLCFLAILGCLNLQKRELLEDGTLLQWFIHKNLQCFRWDVISAHQCFSKNTVSFLLGFILEILLKIRFILSIHRNHSTREERCMIYFISLKSIFLL